MAQPSKYKPQLEKLERELENTLLKIKAGLLSKTEASKKVSKIKQEMARITAEMAADKQLPKARARTPQELIRDMNAIADKMKAGELSVAQGKKQLAEIKKVVDSTTPIKKPEPRTQAKPTSKSSVKPRATATRSTANIHKVNDELTQLLDSLKTGEISSVQGKRALAKIERSLQPPAAPASPNPRTLKEVGEELDLVLKKAKLGRISQAEAKKQLDELQTDLDKLKQAQKQAASLSSKELRVKALEASIAQLEKDEAAIKILKAQTRAAKSIEELRAIDNQLEAISKRAGITPRKAMTEAKAADQLAEELRKGGLRLKKKLPAVAQEILDKPDYTLLELREAIAQELIKESGKMYRPMTEFLESSLGSEFKGLAKADFGVVYGSADDIVPKIVLHGAGEAREYSGNLSRFVLKQVDDTQAASPYLFTRHVEAGACSWCHSQVSVYETTRQFFRHHNCRCMKIRK